MDKYTQAYIPGCELAVDKAMIVFKGRFFLKQYYLESQLNGGSRLGV